MPSDFVRTEYITYGASFPRDFRKYLKSIHETADYYSLVAEQLDRNPILAMDYLKRAYLINGDLKLRQKAKNIYKQAGLEGRAKNSIEQIAASF